MKNLFLVFISTICIAQTNQYKEILLSKKLGKEVHSFQNGYGEIYDSKTKSESIVDSLGNITNKPTKGYFIHLNKNKFIFYVDEKNYNRKAALIDEKGNQLIPLDYQDFNAFWNSSKNLVLTKNKKQSLYNYEGKQIIPFYDEIKFADENRFFVKIGKDWFLFDEKGKRISDRKFNDNYYFENGKILIKNEKGQNELLDINGKTLKHFSKNIVSSIDDFPFFKTQNIKTKKIGLIDENDNVLVDEIYDDITQNYFSENKEFIYLRNSKNDDIYSIKENKIYHTGYKYLGLLFGNYFQFSKEKSNKWGVVNLDNNIILRQEYDYIQNFKISDKNYLYLINGNESKLLDENLKPVFSSDYQIIGIYPNSVILKKDNQFFKNDFSENKMYLLENVISIKDKPSFSMLPNYHYSYPVVFQNSEKKWGIMNGKGTILIPTIYDEIISYRNGENQIVIKKEGKYGVTNYENELLKEMIYDEFYWKKEVLELLKGKQKEFLNFYNADFKIINDK